MLMNVRVAAGQVIVPLEPRMRAMLPLREVTVSGKQYAAIPHGETETKLLRNLGYSVPAPILSGYDWPSTPFDSQRVTAAMLTVERRAYVTSTMGVGKTRAALYAFDWLRRNGIGPALVVTPLSTITEVWDREAFTVFPHLTTSVLHSYSKAKRIEALQQSADIYIVNHDGVKVMTEELANVAWGAIIIDEVSAFSNVSTHRWKAMNKIIERKSRDAYVWGITGSPTPDAPTDAYGIAKLITPWTVPRTMKRFQLDTMYQVSQFRWAAKPNANDIVAKALTPSVRFTLDECHDIPEITFSHRRVDLTPIQKKLYDTMVQQLQVEVKGEHITAVNEGSKLNKLLQISAGFLYSKSGGTYIQSGPRVKELLSIIKQSEKKVLVFAAYKWLVYALAKALAEAVTVEAVTGDTSKKDRDQIFAKFRTATDPQVLVAHAGTMSHGLNLIEATSIVWYGPTLSSETYEQANARIRRPGQTCKTHVIHLSSTAVERRAFSRLEHKQKMQGLLLDILRGVRED